MHSGGRRLAIAALVAVLLGWLALRWTSVDDVSAEGVVTQAPGKVAGGPVRVGQGGVGARPVTVAGIGRVRGTVVDEDEQPVGGGTVVLTCLTPAGEVATIAGGRSACRRTACSRARACDGTVCAELRHATHVAHRALDPRARRRRSARRAPAAAPLGRGPRCRRRAGGRRHGGPVGGPRCGARRRPPRGQPPHEHRRRRNVLHGDGRGAPLRPVSRGAGLRRGHARGLRHRADLGARRGLRARADGVRSRGRGGHVRRSDRRHPAGRGRPIAGTLLDLDDQPYPRAFVLARSEDRPSEQHRGEAADGRFTIDGLGEGTYRLRAIQDGVEIAAADAVAGDAVTMTPTTKAVPKDVVVEVTDAGRPLPGVLVRGGPFARQTTDADGQVRARRVIPGTYILRIDARRAPHEGPEGLGSGTITIEVSEDGPNVQPHPQSGDALRIEVDATALQRR